MFIVSASRRIGLWTRRRKLGRNGNTLHSVWSRHQKGYKIEETVYQYDNAATVAYALGLQTPQAWIGRPVKGAFIGNETPKLIYKRKEQITQPKILPDAGYFEPAGGVFKADSVAVVMQNPNNVGQIRYTIGNTVPSLENSQVYQDTFYLNQTDIIKAGIFQNDQLVSTIAEGSFRIVSKAKAKIPLGFKYIR